MTSHATWRLKVIIAFATLYLVWGSTYLAIRVGVQELPPALFAGVRFIIAAILLGAYAYYRGQALPRTRDEWSKLSIVGLCLFTGANGLVVWGEQWVPSNLAALIAASVALWIALLGSLGQRGEALSGLTLTGLIVGFSGALILLAPAGPAMTREHLMGELAIALACVFWAAGTIYGRRYRPRTPTFMAAAAQMLVGGLALSVIGLLGGEWQRFELGWSGGLALLYLIVFGSCLAFAAYAWLMHEVTPAQLGTYAYINPLVAVLLGAWWLDERLQQHELLGMVVILAGVIIVVRFGARSRAAAVLPPNRGM